MSEIRTRFAPSPTGFLHVGGARTAFYAWLLARHFGGKFLLRIEDTDQKRLIPGAIRSLIEELNWFGIEMDEGPSGAELEQVGESAVGLPDLGGPYGPYIQSLRRDRYQEVAEDLIRRGYAYRCDCTPEMLEKERAEQTARRELPGYGGRCRERNVPAGVKHVVRFKVSDEQTLAYSDAVKGHVSWESISLRDTVILKSDGLPIYHLAVVVDDHDMKISHVLRGDEWLSSAPLHLLIYQALGWTPPVFAHLPVIKSPSGKKLSKRDGTVDTRVFREQGYLPDALLNYLVRIGWSLGEGSEQEIFTRAELIERFSLDRVNNASGIFDYSKLQWMNGVYIRSLALDEFLVRVRPFIENAGLPVREDRLRVIGPHVQERAKLLGEVPAMVDYLLLDRIERDIPAMFAKGVDGAKAKEILAAAGRCISAAAEFSAPALEAALKPVAEKVGLKFGPMFGVLRIAVTGKKVSPPLMESMAALGREETLRRIQDAVDLVSG